MSAQILVVDDTADNLTLMTYLLRAAGHEAISAATGEQALVQAASHQPDLIMLDVQLPDTDGYTILARLREDPRLSKVPVIAVTAYAMVGDRDHALAAGFDAYLAKPIDPYAFAGVVDSHLPSALRGRAPASGTIHQSNADGAGPEPVLGERSATVLAVDNNSVNLRLLRSVLEPHGYSLTTARSVQEAKDALRHNRAELVLCDLHLGGESGTDLWTFLQTVPQLAALPFAFLTSTASAEEPTVSDSQVRVIRRPIEPAQLLRELRALLGSR